MTPSDAARSPRLAACAWPFTRRISTALSTSPPASWSARLQSIIPAPVRSRSAFTSPAETCAASISANLLVGSRSGLALLGGLHVSFLSAARPVQLVRRCLLVALLALDHLARRRGLGSLGLGALACGRLALVVLGARVGRGRGVRIAGQRGAAGHAGAH